MINREIPTNIDFEIINVQPINDFISDCEIKVFYHGKNRNGSYISKAVGTQIANTLPKSPIVAFYNEAINDYEDHGQEMIINRDGVKFITKTVPYGAVSENSPIVWKKFLDQDGTEREYLVCRGFLWTGRYPHLNSVLESSKGQSMEFFPESIQGDWAKFENEEQEFFIFNEASISALCILGDDVEPCFEGASVGKPEVLYSLKKDEFKQEFNNFMLELNKVLTYNLEEGGKVEMNDETQVFELEEEIEEGTNFSEEETEVETEEDEFAKCGTGKKKKSFEEDGEEDSTEDEDENFEKSEEPEDEFAAVEIEINVDGSESDPMEDDSIDVPEELINPDDMEDPMMTDAELVQVLKQRVLELEAECNALQAKCDTLSEGYYQLQEINKQKEIDAKNEICEKFSILGDEIINSFKSNFDQYTVEEIDEKLSAIAFKKGINFNVLEENKDGIITPTPQPVVTKNVPAWLQAVEERVKNK